MCHMTRDRSAAALRLCLTPAPTSYLLRNADSSPAVLATSVGSSAALPATLTNDRHSGHSGHIKSL